MSRPGRSSAVPRRSAATSLTTSASAASGPHLHPRPRCTWVWTAPACRCAPPKSKVAAASSPTVRPRPARSSWSPCGRPKHATNRVAPAATPGRSATTARSRARRAATPTRSRPPLRNASIAKRNGPGCGGARFAPSQLVQSGRSGCRERAAVSPILGRHRRGRPPPSSGSRGRGHGSRSTGGDGRGSGVDASADCPGSLRAGCGGQVRAPRVDVWPVERAGRNSRLLPSVVLNAGGEGADGAAAMALPATVGRVPSRATGATKSVAPDTPAPVPQPGSRGVPLGSRLRISARWATRRPPPSRRSRAHIAPEADAEFH